MQHPILSAGSWKASLDPNAMGWEVCAEGCVGTSLLYGFFGTKAVLVFSEISCPAPTYSGEGRLLLLNISGSHGPYQESPYMWSFVNFCLVSFSVKSG